MCTVQTDWGLRQSVGTKAVSVHSADRPGTKAVSVHSADRMGTKAIIRK